MADRLCARIDVLDDHSLTALVADPLETLDKSGEGSRQPVGVVEVHATKRPGRFTRQPQTVGDGVVHPDHLGGEHRLDRGLRGDADKSSDNVARTETRGRPG